MKKSTKTQKLVIAVMVGATIGAAIGILYAPQSGEATRSRIKKEANLASRKIEQAAFEIKNTAKKSILKGTDGLGYRLGSLIANIILSAKDILREFERKLIELK